MAPNMQIKPITAFAVGNKIFTTKAEAEAEVARQNRQERILQFMYERDFGGDLDEIAHDLAHYWPQMVTLIP